ncbi:hypothetical protein JCM8547_003593 [Rhodosporidiobolus lusitaniae]
MLSTSILAVAALAASVQAHPGHVHERRSPAEFEAHALRARTANNCAAHISALKSRRLAKRASTTLKKRNIPTSALSAASAQATGLLNTTCITTPEAVEGPYYLRNDILRTDVAEDQGGIPLTLDIGLIDISTCEPLTNTLVEIWHANVTGFYSHFTTDVLDTPSGGSGGGMGDGNGTMSFGGLGGMSGAPPSGTAPSSAAPSGSARLAKRSDTDAYDDSTFLRGGYPTNDEGVVEFTSVFPGFYTGRTTHIHMIARKNYVIANNGTIISSAGTVEHIGQLFFSESWNSLVFNTSTYLDTAQTRTYNDDDSILQQDLSAGDWPFVDTQLVGESVEEGLYGYITIGIDTSAEQSISTTNYMTSDDLEADVQASAFAANGLLDYLSMTLTAAATAVSSSATAKTATGTAGVSAVASASGSSGAERVRVPFLHWL